MTYRIRRAFASGLYQAGSWLQALSVAVFRPADFDRLAFDKYATDRQVEKWGGEDAVDSGLTPGDERLIEAVPLRGRALVLYAGGGREAIALARAGFDVEATDAVPAMIDALARNAARRGLGVKATVERADALAPRSEPLELIWVGCGMYSTIPSRRRRVAFLKRLGEQIAPDGRVALSFLLAPYSPVSPRAQSARRALARVLFGYADVQRGDTYWRGAEFVHGFASWQELEGEVADAGLSVLLTTESLTPDAGHVGALLGRATK